MTNYLFTGISDSSFCSIGMLFLYFYELWSLEWVMACYTKWTKVWMEFHLRHRSGLFIFFFFSNNSYGYYFLIILFQANAEYGHRGPNFTFLMLRYFMSLIVGVTCCFWIVNDKTYEVPLTLIPLTHSLLYLVVAAFFPVYGVSKVGWTGSESGGRASRIRRISRKWTRVAAA